MIGLGELERIRAFLVEPGPESSATEIASWCEARDIDAFDLQLFTLSMARATLCLIAALENEEGNEMPPGQLVELAIGAAIVTALQTGLDAERRRRDVAELPR